MLVYVIAYLAFGFIISALAARFGFLEDDELYLIYILAWILFYPIIIILGGVFYGLFVLWLFIAEAGT